MKLHTKQYLLRAATGAAIVCATALVFLPGAAWAAPAEVSSTANLRAGPGTNYQVVGQLSAGTDVDVQGCRSGWCYIISPDGNGYVSASLLRREGRAMEPNFNLSFNFPGVGVTIGNGGVSIGVNPPGGAPGPTPGPTPGPVPPGPGPGGPTPPPPPGPGDDAEVCFFSNSNYSGNSFCMEEGETRSSLSSSWDDRISSIRNSDGLRVTVCAEEDLDDPCRTYTTSARTLGGLNNDISSIRVR